MGETGRGADDDGAPVHWGAGESDMVFGSLGNWGRGQRRTPLSESRRPTFHCWKGSLRITVERWSGALLSEREWRVLKQPILAIDISMRNVVLLTVPVPVQSLCTFETSLYTLE